MAMRPTVQGRLGLKVMTSVMFKWHVTSEMNDPVSGASQSRSKGTLISVTNGKLAVALPDENRVL